MTRIGLVRKPPSAKAATEAAYRRWAPVYDLIFDLPFRSGRRAAAQAAAAAAGKGGAVLVVGVGTGLELPLLPRDLHVAGVDISAEMLKIARERVARQRLIHVESLEVMDAGALAFDACEFDVALAPYVMSVVQDPGGTLDEIWRVLRPGGALIAMNHFAAERGVQAVAEAAMERVAPWLGWRPQFPYSAIGDWLAARPDATLVERRQLPPFGLFTLLKIVKAKEKLSPS
jgi:phosphatidylethanolamine/phosphatidyl-N-methylethanolamine N-methyltransferase